MASVRDQFSATDCKGDIINLVIAATKTFSAEELLIEIGSAVPKNHLNNALVLTRSAVLALPSKERAPLLDDQQSCVREFGELTVCGFEKMLWRVLCAPQSAVYKLWLSKDSQISQAETLIDAIIQILDQRGFRISTLLINIMAFILKKPAQAFCERTNKKIRKGKRTPRPEAKNEAPGCPYGSFLDASAVCDLRKRAK
jgi:hypothetical protein